MLQKTFTVASGFCVWPSTPVVPTTTPGGALRVTDIAARESASELPAWIVNPPALPPGRVGKNNCTFAFGQNVPQWNFHPDAGCWEHAGPDGWTRQQYQKLHIRVSLSAAAVLEMVCYPVCRAPVRQPALHEPTYWTERLRCCVVSFVCH
jgi:hypothetical protein